MQQSATLVIDQITVYGYGFLLYCMAVGQAQDNYEPGLKLLLVCQCLTFVFGTARRGSTRGFL